MRLVIIWLTIALTFCGNLFAQPPAGEDTSAYITVAAVSLVGNKITRDNIILRELEFQVGKPYRAEMLDSLIVKSRQNLLNRSLFNFVTITLSGKGSEREMEVAVIERWYIWPIPIFQFADRNLNAWIEKGDLNRLNYGLDLRVENFRGRMEKLNIIAQTGYDMRFAARWSLPYLNNNQVTGMSMEGGVQFNHEVAVATLDNKPQYYHSAGDFAQIYYFGGVGLTFRPKFNYLHDLGLSFHQFQFLDTILVINPDFACGNRCSFFQFSYTFKLDYRDYKPYPLSGYYFDAQLRKLGLGVFLNRVDLLWVSTTFDQYIPLLPKWFFAYNFSTQFSGDADRPYFLTSGFGDNGLDVRGYELYVVDGQNFGLVKSNLKYEILAQRNYTIPWIKSPKFSQIFFAMYANVFFDVGYASDLHHQLTNPLANQLIWGTGFGLDLVSYYDTVIRLEFTLNKQKETGFFINFVAPI